jgi:hypothetical protein
VAVLDYRIIRSDEFHAVLQVINVMLSFDPESNRRRELVPLCVALA